jgi:hypothetical protein
MLIENFESFNITVIPIIKSTLADSLDIVASILSPLEYYEASRFTVELLYKPSVPNNISNWKVFEGDEQIIKILTNHDNFKDLAIDDEIFQEELVETNPHVQRVETDQLTDKPWFHMILKGVSNLENLFDLREIFKGSTNTKTESSCPMYETINIGTLENPNNINLKRQYLKKKGRPISNFSENIKIFLHGPTGI